MGRLPTGHLRHGAMTTALWLYLQHPPVPGILRTPHMTPDPALTWLKRWESTVSGKVLVKPDSCRRGGGESQSEACLGSLLSTARPRGLKAHLGGGPVDPAFAVGVNVHQHQPLHQVRENELRGEGKEAMELLLRDVFKIPQMGQLCTRVCTGFPCQGPRCSSSLP